MINRVLCQLKDHPVENDFIADLLSCQRDLEVKAGHDFMQRNGSQVKLM